jgi:hypothetical protein
MMSDLLRRNRYLYANSPAQQQHSPGLRSNDGLCCDLATSSQSVNLTPWMTFGTSSRDVVNRYARIVLFELNAHTLCIVDRAAQHVTVMTFTAHNSYRCLRAKPKSHSFSFCRIFALLI